MSLIATDKTFYINKGGDQCCLKTETRFIVENGSSSSPSECLILFIDKFGKIFAC